MTDALLTRIAEALERLVPHSAPLPSLNTHTVFVWNGLDGLLRPIDAPRRVPLALLLGLEGPKDALVANTQRFAAGLPANHALLWGARGTGKSALVKAVHADVADKNPALKLIEVSRNDTASIPALTARLQGRAERFMLFVDDLSFERGDDGYKALKSILDGGVSGDLSNVMVVVTSNRRHLINRDAGGDAGDLRPEETADDQVALSDRFGLWLGFHVMDQATYLAIIDAYCARLKLKPGDKGLHRAALQWAAKRGARSGRVAWQFIVDRAGALGKSVTF